MTATVTENNNEAGSPGIGRVARVIGPVVDIEFPADAIPEMYNALHVDITLGDVTHTITLEVALHVGDNTVRAL
jgi:F-type H+/Na+-transporting ATPase subunit beta